MFRSSQPGPDWFRYQYRSLIRATHTHAELDAARLVEESMLPRPDDDQGQDDVRETPSRMDPMCPDDKVGYLSTEESPWLPPDVPAN
ncbi:hypothetical protein LQ327_08885 [Actinomycetospora endophytica]|uniref:Uncharacterized protein n=1 Tax=Actinomycetospora endophytica TaxID=2291215 RepID=A0ABS8P7V7_9PSEU|nr:hypothetical protein [Actinomycetospora endophytica]MCD2193496.1 hypothetical protein [Actinomycetospora endophytica]